MVNDFREIGRQNRKMGTDTERRVREDLENKNWIVSKWSNNVDLKENKLIKVKNKFRGINVPMMLGAGFPDFVCFTHTKDNLLQDVIGVEAKTDGHLDRIEKEKCVWLLKNKIFSKILIGYRMKVKNKVEIKYKEFVDGEIVEVENGNKI